MDEQKISSLEYKPQIQWVPEEINTIDNTSRDNSSFDQENSLNYDDYYTYSESTDKVEQAMVIYEDIQTSIRNLLKDINFEIPFELNDVEKHYLKLIDGGDKVVDTGKITYDIYEKIIKNSDLEDVLGRIKNVWEENASDLDGSFEAELLPIVNIIDNELKFVFQFLENTIQYSFDENLTAEENEMSLLKSIESIESLLEDINLDPEKRKKYLMELDTLKDRRKYNNLINSKTIDFADIAILIGDQILNEIDQKRDTDQKGLLKYNSLEEDTVKILLLSGFISSKESLYDKGKDIRNIYDYKYREKSYANMETDNKMYLDIASPILNDLCENLLESEAGYILHGLESLINNKNRSLIEYQNNLNSTIVSVKTLFDLLKYKDEIRQTYFNI